MVVTGGGSGVGHAQSIWKTPSALLPYRPAARHRLPEVLLVGQPAQSRPQVVVPVELQLRQQFVTPLHGADGSATVTSAPPPSAFDERQRRAQDSGLRQRDRQSEPVSVAAVGARRAEPARAVAQQLGREAGTVVAHPQRRAVDLDLDRRLAVAFRVLQQVHQHPFEPPGVGADRLRRPHQQHRAGTDRRHPPRHELRPAAARPAPPARSPCRAGPPPGCPRPATAAPRPGPAPARRAATAAAAPRPSPGRSPACAARARCPPSPAARPRAAPAARPPSRRPPAPARWSRRGAGRRSRRRPTGRRVAVGDPAGGHRGPPQPARQPPTQHDAEHRSQHQHGGRADDQHVVQLPNASSRSVIRAAQRQDPPVGLRRRPDPRAVRRPAPGRWRGGRPAPRPAAAPARPARRACCPARPGRSARSPAPRAGSARPARAARPPAAPG